MPRKPTDPATIAKRAAERRGRDFASVGLAPAAAALPQNEGVTVEQVTRADPQAGVRGNEKRAQRVDFIGLMYRRNGLSTPGLDAFRRCEVDYAERRGEAGRGLGLGLRVDCARPIPVSDRSLAAGQRVDAVFSRIGRRDAELLAELIEPRRLVSDAPDRWRAVVRLITGEKVQHAQAAAVRSAVENLALAYREIDHQPRRAA